MVKSVELTKYEYYDFDEMIKFIEDKYKIEIDWEFVDFIREHYWYNDINSLRILKDINWKEILDLINEMDKILKEKYLKELEYYKSIYKPDELEEILKQLNITGFKEPEPNATEKLKYKIIAECFYKEFGDNILEVCI